jgi:hypothetical protein
MSATAVLDRVLLLPGQRPGEGQEVEVYCAVRHHIAVGQDRAIDERFRPKGDGGICSREVKQCTVQRDVITEGRVGALDAYAIVSAKVA